MKRVGRPPNLKRKDELWSAVSIKTLRDRLCMTQVEFGVALGKEIKSIVNATIISRWENGDGTPIAGYQYALDKLAETL